jgi:hypothetical protein
MPVHFAKKRLTDYGPLSRGTRGSAKSWSNPALRPALEYFAVAIRNYHDVGNTAIMRGSLTALAALLDRLGRFEPAATIAGFAFDPLTTGVWVPEINTAISRLREVLGDQTYESLARKGKSMTTAEIATYAYDQIDQAGIELNADSK